MAKVRPFLLILAILILIASLVRPSIVSLAGSTITITASGTDTNPVGNQGGTDRHMAQQFTVGSGGVLTQITIRFAANVGSPSGTATWFIDSDGGNLPGPNITSGTFTPTASATNTLNLNSVLLVTGGKFWLRLQSTNAQTSGNYWQWGGQNTSTYAYGVAAQQNAAGAWSTSTGSGVVELECSITLTDATAEPSHTPPNTPVPTATILPSSTPGVPTATEKPNPTGIPTSTPGVPTATEKPNPTVVPDIDDPTATEKPNPTGIPTSTPYIFVPVPTATEKPNPTGIPTSTPNNTPVDTPTEINTPVDTPTAIAFLDTPTPANTPIDTPTEINTPVDTPTEFVDDDSGFGGPTATPTDTLTPTITDTPTDTPTPSDTPTPTPNLYSILTMEPSGQAGGIIYLVSAGEAAIFAVLAFIISILLVLLFLAFRRSRA